MKRLISFPGNQSKNSSYKVFWKLQHFQSTTLILGVPFIVSAGMVLLLINNLIVIYNNITNEYKNNNNEQIDYSLTRLSLFWALAWDLLYQKTTCILQMALSSKKNRVQSYQTLFVPGISLGPALPKNIDPLDGSTEKTHKVGFLMKS